MLLELDVVVYCVNSFRLFYSVTLIASNANSIFIRYISIHPVIAVFVDSFVVVKALITWSLSPQFGLLHFVIADARASLRLLRKQSTVQILRESQSKHVKKETASPFRLCNESVSIESGRARAVTNKVSDVLSRKSLLVWASIERSVWLAGNAQRWLLRLTLYYFAWLLFWELNLRIGPDGYV